MSLYDEIEKLRRVLRVHARFSGLDNLAVSGDIGGATPNLYGKVADNTGPYPVKGVVSKFGTFTRAVTNADNGFEAPSISTDLIDQGNQWRTWAASPWTVVNRTLYYVLRAMTDGGTHVEADVAWGQISQIDLPKGIARLRVEQQLGDFFGPKVPRRKVTLEDWPNADPSAVGQAVPIIYGKMENIAGGSFTGVTAVLNPLNGTPVTNVTATLASGGNAPSGAPAAYYALAPVDSATAETADVLAEPVVVGPITPAMNQKVVLSWNYAGGGAGIRIWRGNQDNFAQMSRYRDATAFGTPDDLAAGPSGTVDDLYPTYQKPDALPPVSGDDPHWDLEYRVQVYYWLSAVVLGVEQPAVGPVGVYLAPVNKNGRSVTVSWDPVDGADSIIVRRASRLYHFPSSFDREWTLAPSGTVLVDPLNDTTSVTISEYFAPGREGAVECLYVDTNPTGLAGQYKYVVAGHGCKHVREVYVTKGVTDEGVIPEEVSYVTSLPVLQTLGVDYFVETLMAPSGSVAPSGNIYQILRFNASQETNRVTCNVWGIEEEGTATGNDDGGDLIEQGLPQFRHFLLNWVFNSYQSGAWFTDTGYQAGLLDSDSFDAAQAISAIRLAPSGYIGGGALTAETDVRQLIHEWVTSMDVDWYFWENQFKVRMFDDETEIDPATLPQYTPQNTIFRESFETFLDVAQMANRIPWQAGPQSNGWLLAGVANDTESQGPTRYGRIIEAPIFSLPWVRHIGTASDLVARRLNALKNPPIYAKYATPLAAVNDELASMVAVTHEDGIASDGAGWNQVVVKLLRSDIDFDALVVHHVVQDMTPFIPAPLPAVLESLNTLPIVGTGTPTPSGTAWVSGAWAQVLASASEDYLILGLSTVNAGSSTASVEAEVDVGVGGAGSEVVVTTFRFAIIRLQGGTHFFVPMTIPVRGIMAGNRVAIRLRTSSTSTTQWSVRLLLAPVPVPRLLTVTDNPAVIIPSAAVGISITSPSDGSPSAWSVLSASLPTNLAIVGLSTLLGTSGRVYQIDLGVGAEGAETVISTHYNYCGAATVQGGTGFIPILPALSVSAGSRLVYRLSSTPAAICTLAVLAFERPL